MTHIHSLPDELLARIFHEVYRTLPFKEDKFKLARMGHNSRPEVSWMQVIQVCQRWRRIICGERRLWSIINVYHHSDWLALSLGRASRPGIPNEIEVYFRKPKFQPVDLNLLHDHASFLRVFSLYLSPACFPCVSALFTQPLPIVKLSLTWQALYNRVPGDIDLSVERLPDLRSLTLSRISPMGPLSLYSGLRDLRIFNCEWTAPLRACLDMLATCANLENLQLSAALSYLSDIWDPEPQPHGLSSIVLPHLRTLTMDHPSGVNHTILSYLSLPAATTITITDDGPADLLNGIAKTFAAQLPPDLATVVPFRGTIGKVDMLVDRDKCHLVAASPTGRLESMLRSPWRYSDYLPGTCLQDLATLLSGAPVTELSVSITLSEIEEDDMGAVLAALPQLQSLVLTGEGTVDFLWDLLHPAGIMHPSPQDRTMETERPCPNPNLEKLVIGDLEEPVSANVHFFSSMCALLRARAARGYRLKDLQLFLAHPQYGFDYEEETYGGYLEELEQKLVDHLCYEAVMPLPFV